MAGCYTWGNTKSDVNMSNKIRPRKAHKHQKRQRARAPLDLQDIDIDAILNKIIQEEAYSSRTSNTSTLVEKDLNRRDQSLAIAGLQKDSQQQRTVNPEEKEKEETVALQPFKGTPLIISDLQKKNDIMVSNYNQLSYNFS
ncbi:uncharacterized protein LOC115925913 [Strongylocentrotus purpuratus]|uniref:Uncharacterized protein n=1 Tax=Strongylocentrotus purpuratus TaxID=7668 RepID=A0A7M7P5Q8_STRPU|nr:uncharacterized protein LOC115925913 [Strongylocentrotus purpuratus]